MKDALGTPLRPGDKVLVVEPCYSSLLSAEVIRTTPQGATVRIPEKVARGHRKLDWFERGLNRSSYQIAKVSM